MKTGLIIFLITGSILLATKAGAQAVKIDKVRDSFFSMNESTDGALNLYFRLKPLDLTEHPVLLAYRGASSAASAGSVSGIQKKLKYFNSGKEELEKAVQLKPNDPEVRFLRLATQLNAPGFLGYNSSVEEDKKLIVGLISKSTVNDSNSYLYSLIAGYLLTTDVLTSAERQLMIKFRNTAGK